MRVRLPFELLSTASIVAAPYTEPAPILSLPPVQSISSVSSSAKAREVKELDEEMGKRIIELIHDRDGSMEKRTFAAQNATPQQQQQHDDSLHRAQTHARTIRVYFELDSLDSSHPAPIGHITGPVVRVVVAAEKGRPRPQRSVLRLHPTGGGNETARQG